MAGRRFFSYADATAEREETTVRLDSYRRKADNSPRNDGCRGCALHMPLSVDNVHYSEYKLAGALRMTPFMECARVVY